MYMNSAEEIHKLMTEKLAGIISAADDQWLEDLIEEDPVVREKWEMLSGAPVPAPPAPWKEVIDFKPKKPLYKILLPYAIAAAVLGATAMAIWQVAPWKKSRPTAASAPVAINYAKHVTLQLADKSVILLDTADAVLIIQGQQISNKNNILYLNTLSRLPAGQNTLQVPAGKKYDVVLPDGSLVSLNAATTLSFPSKFEGRNREISVNGEAYLKIAPQARQPFLVHLPHTTVEVLGTSFNINSYDNSKIRVCLVDGKVKVKAGKKEVLVKPGQQAIFNEQTTSLRTQPFNATVELGWQKGLYSFSDTPLNEVCESIFRWYGVKAVLDNQDLNKRKFSALLEKSTPLSFLLEGVKATTGTDYYFSADSTLHFK
ncbi:FecR family protein [Chitinophaga terrae (ex Kim and Jung 2007)]|uniref:FecR family protein n=2 Tax=Chitinophaga terrae (ex Kim and Jung 2007) TaxID=408074 RepID=A0A1H4CHM7_9BACT|nr:FecR family protein [Chitinophaga terrae (ex Kim and Jung 2007)]